MGLFDFDTNFEKNLPDYNNEITARSKKIQTRIRFENRTKRESAEKTLIELPNENESIHIVSNGRFDYFTLIPRVLQLKNETAEDFWFSTIYKNYQNGIELADFEITTKIYSLAKTGDLNAMREFEKRKKLNKAKNR